MSIRIALFLLMLILFGCQSDLEERPDTIFEQKSGAETGLKFTNDLFYSDDFNIIEYLYFYNGSGVAIGDINNDGWEDVYMGANQTIDRLFLNKGSLQFDDITEEAGLIMDNSWTNGIAIDDINGDGHKDIYVCKLGILGIEGSHNLVYINNGDGTFTEKAKELGLDFSGFSTHASFFDFDKDGDLDMYLLNHSIHSIRSYGDTAKRSEKDTLAGDVLYENRLNQEEGKFVDITREAGIYNSALGYGLAVTTTDVNEDGWIDIYVGNDFHENDYLYLNNGDKTFTESVTTSIPHTSQFSMGVDANDMDNDGDIDLFTTDMMPEEASILMRSGGEDSDLVGRIKKDFGFHNQYANNHFQLNDGTGRYSDIAYMTNTYASDWSWSVLLQDYNNDGFKDIFITNGIVKRPNDLDYINFIDEGVLNNLKVGEKTLRLKEAIDKMPEIKISNKLFLNQIDKNPQDPFIDLDIGDPSFSNGAAYSDLDRDGDLDIVLNNLVDPSTILENKSNRNGNNYLSVELVDKGSDASLKGTRVLVYSADKKFVNEYNTTRGFQSSSTHYLHFGLGTYNTIDSIIVQWPDEYIQKVIGTTPNQYLSIERDENLSKKRAFRSGIELSFSVQLFPYKHQENEYFDELEENLIPEYLSKEGPAIEVADFNKDGRNDIYIGGTVYQAPILYLAEQNGSYTPKNIPDFEMDAIYEDVDVVAFDFDNDDDLDLYVVSGGSDKKELDSNLEDRLYLNDGNANFRRHKISLPHTNGSVAAAGDYNNDGYIDLFVGARSIPGSYGLSPISFILKNNNGQFFDLDYKQRFGMTTDAQWIDLNKDDLLDLVFTGDWMPISVFMNTGEDDFIDKTDDFGLSNTNGFWNAIDFADVDKDGDLDIVAGNAGLNLKWQASDSLPVTLYLDDYDQNGKIDPIIFYNYKGEFIPFATKDQLGESLPYLKKKFQSYNEFSTIRTIEELTGKKAEELIEIKYIKELRSMLFLQDEHGFIPVPLPAQAQMSAIQDFLIDENRTGDPIIYFVGNNKEYTRNLGTSMSNSGGVLLNFDSNTNSWMHYSSLPLPMDLNTRLILQLDERSMLVGVNNSMQYILSSQ